ncbi:MAG: FAD-dependent monooxygenase, partial [Burkholderiales bacterium]|nr:FAD-dependent monooxygenase [Burkholderiales bacterium]
ALAVLLAVASVGAGPVGASLALALAGQGLDVLALDARPPHETLRGDRSIALAHGSRLILERVGVWPRLAAVDGAVTAIAEIDVSQAGGFGVTRLRAGEHGVEALGHVVSYVALQRALDDALAAAGVPVRFGASVASIDGGAAQARIVVAGDAEPVEARVVAVADGAGAAVAGIARERHDYRQNALVAPV